MRILRFSVLACICLVFSGILGCGEHPVYDRPGFENGLTSKTGIIDASGVDNRGLAEDKLQECGYV